MNRNEGADHEHRHHPVDHPHTAVTWGIAILATQSQLGLRSKRHHRPSSGRIASHGSVRTHLATFFLLTSNC